MPRDPVTQIHVDKLSTAIDLIEEVMSDATVDNNTKSFLNDARNLISRVIEGPPGG